jgi:hypothetical protein
LILAGVIVLFLYYIVAKLLIFADSSTYYDLMLLHPDTVAAICYILLVRATVAASCYLLLALRRTRLPE